MLMCAQKGKEDSGIRKGDYGFIDKIIVDSFDDNSEIESGKKTII